MARAPAAPEKFQKRSKMSFFFSCFEKFWYRKIFFGRIRGFPELPRIFRFLLASAADDVREQTFGFKNPGQFFFPLKTSCLHMPSPSLQLCAALARSNARAQSKFPPYLAMAIHSSPQASASFLFPCPEKAAGRLEAGRFFNEKKKKLSRIFEAKNLFTDVIGGRS